VQEEAVQATARLAAVRFGGRCRFHHRPLSLLPLDDAWSCPKSEDSNMNKFKTADLCDEHGDNAAVCEPLFRDYGGRRAFCGEIVTVKCFEDNSLVRTMLSEHGEGRVLVVDAGASDRCAMLGDQLAQKAVFNGWAGILMNGHIRDTAEIAKMALGVKALGSHPRKSVKAGRGEIQVPVSFAGVAFRPGDALYADEDGVLLLNGEQAHAPCR
jgi:regulator of ribonuclease activity A